MKSHRARESWILAVVLFAPAAASRADEGMWLFNRAPVDALKKDHGFDATPQWLEHLQKSSVRFSTGGSGSIVSASGLVMTNHHVGAEVLHQLSTAENDLLAKGFYAATHAEEPKCPDLELLCLWTIEDVTERVNSAASAQSTAGEGQAARRKMMSTIEKEETDQSGLKCEVVTLYQGGRYHLYRYRRYTDVRLVFAPEKQIAFFGGDPDNFEYPRFCLDVSFFRIYENDKPLKPEHHLKWSSTGAAPQDLVFVSGHPGRTERLFTVDHLAYLRDVQYPSSLQRLWRREVQLANFSGRSEEWRRIAEDDFFSVQNSRKAYTGLLAGILDPEIVQQKVDAERRLQAAVWSNQDHKAKWGNAWEQISQSLNAARSLTKRSAALGRSGFSLGSQLQGIAKDLVRAVHEKQKPSAERLREYNDAQLQSLEFALFSDAPIYPDLEIDRLESALSFMAESLGGEDPMLLRALAGKSPRARAEELVRGCTLTDVETRKKLYAGGVSAIQSANDPMIKFVLSLDEESRGLRKRWEDEVEGPQREGYAKIASAKFAVEGENVYPDATFTLRLAYGKVKGYEENGKELSPFTTMEGLYERHQERHGAYPFNLDSRWLSSKSKLNLATPFNFVHTSDIIGGNSGSPTVDRKGEVVGLIFDGNLQSLIWDICYTDEQGRATSVDSRAIVEAINKVYGASALAQELVTVGG